MTKKRNAIASFLILCGVGISVGEPIHAYAETTDSNGNPPARVENREEHHFSRPPLSIRVQRPRPKVDLNMIIFHEKPLELEHETSTHASDIKDSIESIDRNNKNYKTK